MSIRIKHLKSAISSLNQNKKKIISSDLLGKNTFSNKILNQWKQSSDNRLRQISSYFRYDESNNNQKIYPSDLKTIADSLKKQKRGYVSLSKHDLQKKLKKDSYLAYQKDLQNKVEERQSKQEQKRNRRVELYDRLGTTNKGTETLANRQSPNQQSNAVHINSPISSFWQTTQNQVLGNQKPRYSISALKSSKPISMIKEANIKPLPKISLVR